MNAAKWEWYNGCSYWRLGIAGDQWKHDAILRPYVAADGHAEIAVSKENRALIAAAPDGYELAKHILAMRHDVHFSGYPEWQEIVNEAAEFIAKAEGK